MKHKLWIPPIDGSFLGGVEDNKKFTGRTILLPDGVHTKAIDFVSLPVQFLHGYWFSMLHLSKPSCRSIEQ